ILPSIYTSIRFSFNAAATTEIYTLSLHDALPILGALRRCRHRAQLDRGAARRRHLGPRRAGRRSPPRASAVYPRSRHAAIEDTRSEEHTSELQSRFDLVCRLLLEKKKKKKKHR